MTTMALFETETETETTRGYGYENAPATQMLATHCAICGRALVDAESVERGVGPDCAEKYGFGDASGPADWNAAETALWGPGEKSILPELLARPEWGTDAHRIANALVHRVACEQGSELAVRCVSAIAALGYQRLAAACATHRGSAVRKNVETVAVSTEGELLIVKARKNDAFTVACRSIPGSRWDSEKRQRTFPVAARRQVWEAIKASFPPGTVVVGTKTVVL